MIKNMLGQCSTVAAVVDNEDEPLEKFGVMINGTIKKYEIKKKHKIYVKTLAGKNQWQKRNVHYQFERDYKVQRNRE